MHLQSKHIPKFSGWLDSIIGAAVNIGVPVATGLIQQGQAGANVPVLQRCGQVQLKKDGEIALCLDAALPPMVVAMNTTSVTAEKLQIAQALLAFITNPTYFKQDASKHYLGNEIRVWTKHVADLKTQLLTEQASGRQTVNGVLTNVPVTVIENSLIEGVPNMYLFGAGALLVLAFMFKK